MTSIMFLGLGGYQWIALVTAALTLLVLADALAGHYRSGFKRRAQYIPFVSGGILIVAAICAASAPHVVSVNTILRGAAWLAVASGIAGFGLHQYYGIFSKPGGYKWTLHYLMYGAPALAPLALAADGFFALVTARGLLGETYIGGLSLRAALYWLVSLALTGAIVQAGIHHYRGAFNNPLMYAPLTIPVCAVLALVWVALLPGPLATTIVLMSLWATFFVGFIGLGMHLRGFDRQMAGLYVAAANWLEGPPAWAPGLFAGFALIGVVTVTLL